ncbi:MAG: dTMP kinase [Bacteroidales bacterium]|nr:dTMP kinase [Bacteroidales bacterium]MCR5244803.1 dTMP kinase [Bacteroidales bacterium]
MLIVLEGLDGSGKSTQVKMLREYLQKVCSRLEYIHFPRYNSPVYGELIGKFLRGDFGELNQVHPQLVALLYAEDRHGAVPEIRKGLEDGGTVLLDRYVYSNLAYQCAKMPDRESAEELREWIINTEFGSFGEPRPDINIFLDVPMGFVQNSLNHNRQGADRGYLHGARDIHEADLDFQEKVRAMYLRQAEVDPSLTVIDCASGDGAMLPPDAIFEKIKALIDERI